jgi:leucyl-tRNA synthetase
VAATVRRVTEELDGFRFNTAIAALMALVTRLERAGGASAGDRRTLVLLLAPLTPFVAEELWARLGGSFSVHTEPWPEVGSVSAVCEVELVVQVDGKVRDRLRVPAGLDEAAAVDRALASERVRARIDGRPRRVVHVPDRLVNLVTR